MTFSPIVLQILQVGFVGLAFLLAYMAYRLLHAQSEKEKPNKQVLDSTSKYMTFALALALIAVAGQLAQSLIPANIPSDIDGRLKNLSSRIDAYKIKGLYLHTCARESDRCNCPPGYRVVESSDSLPITNYGAPNSANRLLCIQ
jgi:hypothetical protein